MTVKLMSALTVIVLSFFVMGCSGSSGTGDTDGMKSSNQKSETNAAMGMKEQTTIVNIVADHPQLNTLATALTEAQLKPALEAHGPYTLFAPSNDAFKALPPGVLDKLMKPVNRDKLQMILKFHVVRGYYPADKVMKTTRMLTLEGQSLPVDVRGGQVYVDGAHVTKIDLDARNGVVHEIDKVLLPSGFDVNSLQ